MEDISAQDRIKIAAAKVFTLKGLEGARMQDIADEANINKAMLHYYFKNKQLLFEMIFQEKVVKIFSTFSSLLSSDDVFEEKIKKLISNQIDIISEFPVMPLFVMLEARKNPNLLKDKFREIPLETIRNQFSMMIEIEVSKGNIRPIKMEELLINLMALCVYPIIAEPMLSFVFEIEQQQYKQFLMDRKAIVANLLIHDLKPRNLK